MSNWEKPSREKFHSRRAHKARKHAEKSKRNAPRNAVGTQEFNSTVPGVIFTTRINWD